MEDNNKTKQALLAEISSLRLQVSKLQEQLHLQNQQSEKDIEERLAVTINNIPLAILNLDRFGYITAANPAFLKTFDTTAADIINKMNVKNFKPFLGTELSLKISQMIDQKVGFDIEAPFPLNKDKDAYFKCRGTVVSSKMSDALSFILIIGDVSKRKMTEYELIKALEKAEESDKLKTAFLTSMSHEIRTPMNHIIGFVDFLRDPDLPQNEREEYSQIVFDSGQVLLRLIDDIIDIAKIESGQMRLHKTNFVLNEMIHNLYRSYDQLRTKKGKQELNFKLNIPAHISNLTVNTDAVRLQQIFSNLLDNAFKFTDTGTIEMGFEIIDRQLHFFVKDTGVGISKDKHELIFKRFRQLDYSSTKKYGGTGLGLSIIKGLIDLLEGEVILKSEPGTGSEFRFTIPAAIVQIESKPTPDIKELDHTYHWPDKQILIVEDERMNYNLLLVMLRPTRVKVLWAMDGEEAIQLIRDGKEKIDLILMDIRLPRTNGYEATEAIKKLRPDIPVIAQTAYAMDIEIQKAQQAGCDAYITKPIDRHQLLETIFSFLT
ncbi:MAG: ATP-binding protein [Bacteroidales bacterium]|jgi:PAS domain S-box-containing protein|nr:ATP-binding protein [Bacteroidales bacterium]